MSNLVWLRMLPGGAPRVLELGGEIDLHTAGELRGPLQALPGVDVIADLSRLRFLGAAGLTLLLQTRDQLAATGHTLHLACPAPTVRRLINLFDLAEALPCWPTVAQARVAAERRHDSSDATWTGSI
ncbi:MAG: STAS domain-containing protein [Sciscionella sp.]